MTKVIVQDETLGAWIALNNTFRDPDRAEAANNPESGFRSGVLFQLGAFQTTPGLTLRHVDLLTDDGKILEEDRFSIRWINLYEGPEVVLAPAELDRITNEPIHDDLQVLFPMTYWAEVGAPGVLRYQVAVTARTGFDHQGLSTFEFTTASDVAVEVHPKEGPVKKHAAGKIAEIRILADRDHNHGSHIDPPR